MPAPTPQITLTATLIDFSGVAIGTAANPAYLRISLAGYGQRPPEVPGAGSIAKVASWPGDFPFTGTMLTIPLWGNDVIVPGPDVTYYAISVLDTNKNVLQTACYRFDGTQTIDLSNAVPIVPAPVPPVPLPPVPVQGIQYLPCVPIGPQAANTVYTAPGQIIGVFYGGILQRKGTVAGPTTDWIQLSPTTFMATFPIYADETVLAMVAVVPSPGLNLEYGAVTPTPPQAIGAVYTAPGAIVQVFYGGVAQGSAYVNILTATTFSLNFATNLNDDLEVLYVVP